MDLVVRQVQVGEDLGRKKELSNLSCTGVGNLIMGQIELTDGLVEHQAFNQDTDQVIINQVTWQAQVAETLRSFEAL